MISYLHSINNASSHLRLARLAVLLIVPFRPASADDTVRFVRGAHGELSGIMGEILEYSDRRLVMRNSSGRRISIPADSVRHIESQWLKEHVTADKHYVESRFDEALRLYASVLRAEDRAWVRDRLLARVVWCYRAKEQYDRAGDAFLLMMRHNRQSPNLSAIPLQWRPYQPPAKLEARAKEWMQNNGEPLASLMGASWLLSGRDGLAARQRLRQLQENSSSDISLLARTQMWRSQLATATSSDLDRWKKTIDELPSALRAGPYFLLATVQNQHQRSQEASLTFLRVAILYPRHQALAADSLFETGRLLEKAGQPTDAVRLYREIERQYPESPSAQLARQRTIQLAAVGSSN